MSAAVWPGAIAGGAAGAIGVRGGGITAGGGIMVMAGGGVAGASGVAAGAGVMAAGAGAGLGGGATLLVLGGLPIGASGMRGATPPLQPTSAAACSPQSRATAGLAA